MAPSPLGRDALRQALAPAGRVVIVNKSPADGSLTIAAAAIARHDSGGASRQSLTMLDVAADESEWIDPPLPVAEAPALIEVLLRISRSGQIVETYASALPPSPPPPRGWEAGIRPQSTPADPADVPIPELPGFAAYLIPFE